MFYLEYIHLIISFASHTHKGMLKLTNLAFMADEEKAHELLLKPKWQAATQ